MLYFRLAWGCKYMTGYVIHKDTGVLRVENDIVVNNHLSAPLGLEKGCFIVKWLQNRVADNNRVNVRLLKKRYCVLPKWEWHLLNIW